MAARAQDRRQTSLRLAGDAAGQLARSVHLARSRSARGRDAEALAARKDGMAAMSLDKLSQLFTLAFAVSSMFSMGLSLSAAEVIEPLRDLRLTVKSLLANFVIVPAAAILLASKLGLRSDLRTGLLLAASVAGAPMTVKLAQIAKADPKFAVSLVALLVVGTVIFLPLALPLLLPGVRVDAFALAKPLAAQILLPLAAGLFVNARYPEAATELRPPAGQVANISLMLVLVLTIGLNLGDVFGLFGTGAILAILLLIAIALAAGYLFGGPDAGTKRVLALGTGQRNLAAAFVIGAGNFGDRPDVMAMLGAVGLVGLIVVMPLASEFGKRGEPAGSRAGAAAAAPGGQMRRS
jgi:BASS family bile acid:Na+ symporter